MLHQQDRSAERPLSSMLTHRKSIPRNFIRTVIWQILPLLSIAYQKAAKVLQSGTESHLARPIEQVLRYLLIGILPSVITVIKIGARAWIPVVQNESKNRGLISSKSLPRDGRRLDSCVTGTSDEHDPVTESTDDPRIGNLEYWRSINENKFILLHSDPIAIPFPGIID